MVPTGLEKSWNLTLDLKSHGILCWPGKMAFCLEKSLKISGSHWKIACAMLKFIWTWKHWWLYDKKCHFVITFETILVKPCLQTCIAELLWLHCCRYLDYLLHCSSLSLSSSICRESINDQSPLHLTVSGGVLVVQNTTSYREINMEQIFLQLTVQIMYDWWWCFSMAIANCSIVVAFW